MSKSLKGIAGLIEISAVAVEPCPLMSKMNAAIKNSRIGIRLFIKMEEVSMDQIDTSILHSRLARRTFTLAFLCARSTQTCNQGHDQQKIERPLQHTAMPFLLLEPTFVFKITILVIVVQAGIYVLNLINDPLVDTIALTFLQHHFL